MVTMNKKKPLDTHLAHLICHKLLIDIMPVNSVHAIIYCNPSC